MSTPSTAAGSTPADEDENGLSQQNEIIIIAVCTVVGAFALGVMLGLLFCFLRKRRRERAGASGSETRLVRGGDFEIIEAPQQGFSHWNGRRVESFTPFFTGSEPPLNRHFDPTTRAGDNSAGTSPASPPYYNPSLANSFIPQPPPARKPVGSAPNRNRHTYAAGLEAIAGAAAARHQERTPRARSAYQEDDHRFEQQPLTRHDPELSRHPERQHGDFRRNGHDEQMTQQMNHSGINLQEPHHSTAAFGLAGFVGSSREHQRHGALEPGYPSNENLVLGQRSYIPYKKGSSNHYQRLHDEQLEPALVSRFSDSIVDSESVLSALADASNQPFQGNDHMPASTTSNEIPLLAHRTSPQNITKRGILENTSTNDSAIPIPRLPEDKPQDHATVTVVQSPPTSPKSPVAGQGRLSFSRPRPKPAGSFASSGSSIHNRERSSGESGRYDSTMNRDITPPPPIPWNVTPRGSSESVRSIGPDGKPRRLRLSDFVSREENRDYGVGRAL